MPRAAAILQLDGRGHVEPGMAADLAVFDPATIQDRATFIDPLQYAEGIEFLLINGIMVIDGGQVTDARPGTVIRH